MNSTSLQLSSSSLPPPSIPRFPGALKNHSAQLITFHVEDVNHARVNSIFTAPWSKPKFPKQVTLDTVGIQEQRAPPIEIYRRIQLKLINQIPAAIPN